MRSSKVFGFIELNDGRFFENIQVVFEESLPNFAELNDNMNLTEEMIKFIIRYALDNAPEEMAFFNNFVEKT